MPNRKIYFLLFILFTTCTMYAQLPTGPEIAWQRCYGGSGLDFFTDAITTSDGGVLASIKASSDYGGSEGIPSSSSSIIKFNNTMEVEWQQFSGYDTCQFTPYKIFELESSDFIYGGYSGSLCEDYHGNSDFGIMKMNNLGNKLWQKSYGGPGTDAFESFLATADGGFLLSGRSSAAGGDIPFHYPGGAGDDDAIVIKTDSLGEIIWVKVLGGTGDDGPLGDIVENERGYYIINIGAHSNDYDLAESGISGDKRWIVKLDSLGNIVDESFMSGTLDLNTYTNDMIIPYKNGFLIAGRGNATSPLYPTTPEHAMEEGAIAIFNENLELIQFKQWGGSESDGFRRVIRDDAGNFYFIGAAASPDYDLPGNYNNGNQYDYWLFATDSNFNTLWSRNFGGSDPCGDLACEAFRGDILIKNNMLYAFIKNTIPDTFPDFDIECGHERNFYFETDAWLVAFDLTTVEIIEPETTQPPLFEIYPNPAGNEITIKNNTEGKQYYIKIQDVAGRKIYNEATYINEEAKINSEYFSPGLYIISIADKAKMLFTTQIIIAQ